MSGTTNNIINALHKAARDINKTFPKRIVSELNSGYKSIIKDWYDDYNLKSYRRKYRLTDTFKATARGTKISCKFYTDDIDYGSSGLNDYIYDLTIVHGYHGGADKGRNHPSPGTPWYINPRTRQWLDDGEAEHSFSPHEEMKEYIKIKTPTWQKQLKNELVKKIKNYL